MPTFAPIAPGLPSQDATMRPTSFGQPIAAAVGGKARLLVSDGSIIQQSTDGGCSWHTVYSLVAGSDSGGDSARALVSEDYSIVQLVVGSSVSRPATPPADVYALLADTDSFATVAPDEATGVPMFLAASHDGGATWHTSVISAPLPTVPGSAPITGSYQFGGLTTRLLVAPSRASVLYITLVSSLADGRDTGHQNQIELLTSRDAGVTWTYQGVIPQRATATVVDPQSDTTLYAAAGNVVQASKDSGHTWAVAHAFPGTAVTISTNVIALDASRDGKSPTRLLLTRQRFDGTNSTYFVSRSLDAGRTWGDIASPVQATACSFVTGAPGFGPNGRDAYAAVTVQKAYSTEPPYLYRWGFRDRRWHGPTPVAAPPHATSSSPIMMRFAPVDAARRFWLGLSTSGLSIYDAGRG